MTQKNPNRIKHTLIYLGWGLLAVLLILILMLVAGLVDWGI